MLSASHRRREEACCGGDEYGQLLLPPHEEDGETGGKVGGEGKRDEGLAYGSFHPSPPVSPQRQGSLTGKGKKRAASKDRCAHHHHRHETRKHSPLMWLKFSLTLAFAVGAAFKDGPGSLLRDGGCGCWSLRKG